MQNQLKNFNVFNISDIRKIDPQFDLRRLSEWTKKGYIKKIRNGWYVFSNTSFNEQSLFVIANQIYTPSYVSLESTLSLYEIIPEGVYSITSVTPQKKESFTSPIGTFLYRHIKPELFFGYTIQKQSGQSYKQAELEKALLDYLYFHPTFTTTESFHEARFHREILKKKVDKNKLTAYMNKYANVSLQKRAHSLITYIYA